jgi:eukaryotic-like serine/threonine-protein kinase
MDGVSSSAESGRVVGRYALYGSIAAGGMATVHLGRLLGPVGFSRTVAIKRLHAQFASDPEFVSMFLDEARLAARIRHPNVVPTLDVVANGGELFLVMEYVPGESVSRLARAMRERRETIPLRILSAVMAGVLHGLHAAHEARDERGDPLGIVHRDVSPQNVLVGTDGVPRVLDFGVAKAAGRVQTTKEGQIKGKLAYMPPEQLRGAAVSRQTDIYAAGVMLWELVTGKRLFTADNEGALVAKVLEGRIDPPSRVLFAERPELATDENVGALGELDRTALRALDKDPSARFATAREMALAIERTWPPATSSEVGDWVESIAKDVLSSRAAMIAEIESSASHASQGGRSDVMVVLAQREQGPQFGPETAAPTRVSTPLARQGERSVPSPSSPSGSAAPARSVAYAEGPPFTQPSSISVARAQVGPNERGGGRWIALAAILGLMIGVGVLVSAIMYRKAVEQRAHASEAAQLARDEPPAPPVTEPPALEPPDGAEGPRGDAEAHAGKPVQREPAEALETDERTADEDEPRARAEEPARPPAARPHKARAPSVAGDCDPPHWFDAQGVKRYKAHCLDSR